MNEQSELAPFRGLLPFTEDDAPFFFGREREIRIIGANLRTRRLTLLYGPTGVGKTSLLHAGVVHSLRHLNTELRLPALPSLDDARRDGFNLSTSVVRPNPSELGTSCPIVVVILSSWGDDPVRSFKEAVIRALEDSLPSVFTAHICEQLLALELLEVFRQPQFKAVAELLVVFDQFEQYFVNHPVDEGRQGFADQFCRIIASGEIKANFLISIREDWLASLDRFKGRIPSLFDNSIRVNHLDRKAAEDAIRKPIDKYNETIRASVSAAEYKVKKAEIEESFVPEVLNQLERLDERQIASRRLTAGANSETEQLRIQKAIAEKPKDSQVRIQAAGLQVVLKDLWEAVKDNSPPTLAFNLVRAPGTVKEIIQSNVEKILGQLGYNEKLLAAEIFRFLITTPGTKQSATADDLTNLIGRPGKEWEDKIAALLNKLSEPDFRILTQILPRPGESNTLKYELTSDVLAIPIRAWYREIRFRRRRWRILRNCGIALATVVAFMSVIVALMWARQRAAEQLLIATEERAKAQLALSAIQRLDAKVPYSKVVLRGHGDQINSAVFTRDGRVLTASSDGSAILWKMDTGQQDQVFRKDEKPLVSAAVNPKGSQVITASIDGSLSLWTVGSSQRTELRPPNPPSPPSHEHITAISFNKGSDLIAAATTAGEVIVWNANSLKLVKQVPGNGFAIRQLAFSPNGSYLATASEDFLVRVWRTSDWTQTNTLGGHTDKVCSIAFRPDEQFIASGGADATLRVWELSNNQPYRVLMGHAGTINSVDYSDDGQRLLTGSDDTTARVWIIETSKSLPLVGHTDRVISSSFSPTSQQVVTASKDGLVRIWSARSGGLMVEFQGHTGQINYVTYSDDGHYVLSAGVDGTARVWYATDSSNFTIDQPTIVAIPPVYVGSCPVTISFQVKVTALSGSGKVVYRFVNSEGRTWLRDAAFDQPSTQNIYWYWRLEKSYRGFQTIEILEPKGMPNPQTARFSVTCLDRPAPTPSETATPAVPTVTP